MYTYVVEGIPVLHTASSSPSEPHAKYHGIQEQRTILQAGFKKTPQNRAFEVDTIWEQDVPLQTREGVTLRADVFRPVVNVPIPALVAWSPYGKSGTGVLDLDVLEGRAGIPLDMVSGFQSFEAFDPAEWTRHGYAVVNVDAQGIFSSDGHHKWHGAAEGRDGHDAIEAIAALPWCDGKVALMGNSWLASAQWFIAAERPPHLVCMLPLEGLSDVYRESLCRGGVPYLPFWTFLGGALFSRREREDTIGMLVKHPLMNSYWEDKRAKAHLIQVPAYVLASMSTGLHTVGSLRCFEDIPHDNKWLRLNPTQEWHDLYQPDNVKDFKNFLDFHTKGVCNGWEQTPKARISILRYNQPPVVNVPFTNWPVPGTKYQKLYLSATNQLSPELPSMSSVESYQVCQSAIQADDDEGFAFFDYTFQESVTLIGASRVVLYMSCTDHDDMDVFVIIRKKDSRGNTLRNINIPIKDLVDITNEADVPIVNTLQYIGPSGVLRASHRAIDESLSKAHWIAHDHSHEDKIVPGEVVRLEIGLWPGAIRFAAGETLSLRIAGHSMVLAEFEPLRGKFLTSNGAKHTVHFGGENNSYLVLPLVEV